MNSASVFDRAAETAQRMGPPKPGVSVFQQVAEACSPDSLPAASLAAGFHAPSDDGALSRSHGRREDATDAASQEAASRRRAAVSETPPPPGAQWNVPPDAPRTWSPQVMVDRWCDLIARNLATLADYVADHKDGLNLSETMRNLERIDEERRRITLGGISDTPLVHKGRLIDEVA